MKLSSRFVAIAFALCTSMSPTYAQGNDTVIVTMAVKSASGKVLAPDRMPLKDVVVSVCDRNFVKCVSAAKTDDNGNYTLPKKIEGRRTMYLKYTLPVFNLVELTVKVSRNASKLQVFLPLGV